MPNFFTGLSSSSWSNLSNWSSGAFPGSTQSFITPLATRQGGVFITQTAGSTGTVASPSFVLNFTGGPTCTDPTILEVGRPLFSFALGTTQGPIVPVGATIVEINTLTNTILMSKGSTNTASNQLITIGSDRLFFPSGPTCPAEGLLEIGARLFGPAISNIPSGATISAIGATVIIMSIPSFVTSTTAIPLSIPIGITNSVINDAVFGATSPDCLYGGSAVYNLFTSPNSSGLTIKSLDMSAYQGTLTFNADTDPITLQRWWPAFMNVRESISFGIGATITCLPMVSATPESAWGDTYQSWYTFIIGSTGASFSLTTNGKNVDVALYMGYPNSSLLLNDDLTISRQLNIIPPISSKSYLKSSVPGVQRQIYVDPSTTASSTYTWASPFYITPSVTSILLVREYIGPGPVLINYCDLTDIYASGKAVFTYNGSVSNCFNCLGLTSSSPSFAANSSFF